MNAANTWPFNLCFIALTAAVAASALAAAGNVRTSGPWLSTRKCGRSLLAASLAMLFYTAGRDVAVAAALHRAGVGAGSFVFIDLASGIPFLLGLSRACSAFRAGRTHAALAWASATAYGAGAPALYLAIVLCQKRDAAATLAIAYLACVAAGLAVRLARRLRSTKSNSGERLNCAALVRQIECGPESTDFLPR